MAPREHAAPSLLPQSLEAAVKRELWEPRQARRAAWLAHTPCTLETLVVRGLLIGIDCAVHPELMWLTEVR